MKCLKNNGKEVFVKDCENCITEMEHDIICEMRGLVFGSPDQSEPIWEYSITEAKVMDITPKRFIRASNYHTSKSKATKTLIPEKIRWDILGRDNFTCQACGSRRYLQIDHIKPESLGGGLEYDNLQVLCKKCNGKKGNKYA